MKISVPSAIASLQAYKPGRSIEDVRKEYQVERWIKLASNENPLGMSPSVAKQIPTLLKSAHLYPHPRAPKLTQALADHAGVSFDQVVVTAGVDSLLAYAMMAFVDQGEHVLTSEGSFIGTYVNAQKLKINVCTTKVHNHAFDMSAMSNAIDDKTKIIYIANPNNPTGLMVDQTSLEAFLAKVPETTLVILDEAYFEYAQNHTNYPNGVLLLPKYSNLLITRTMSKAYGLAGMRVGYGIASQAIIETLLKVKLPFEPTAIASEAALCALNDQEFLRQTLELNQKGMAFFEKELQRLGLSFVRPSVANFVMLAFDTPDKARKFTQGCLEKGLIVRYLDRFGFDMGVRINTGTEEENKQAMRIVENVWQSM